MKLTLACVAVGMSQYAPFTKSDYLAPMVGYSTKTLRAIHTQLGTGT